MKKLLTPAAVLLLALFLSACSHSKTTSPNKTENSQDLQSTASFQTPKKSAHYETNTPAHGSTLAGVPINVVIDFNFDLAKPSSISITTGGVEYGQGETTIDAGKLAMRRNVDPAAPDGVYIINYIACWPDTSCHDGSFQFAIDKTQAGTFINMTGQDEVTIELKNIMFGPKNVKVSKGTTVVFVNSDTQGHYVNTDSHPAHTYLLDMNSKELKQGDTYSYKFETPGIYPYHCSAHASTMTANILVE